MNANELADELDKYKGIATRDAATMLRQQQAEIEALKISLSGHSAEILSKNDETLPNGKYEPVAWLEPEWGEKVCLEVGYEITTTDDHPLDLCWIPLYTHPAKEQLTDEDAKQKLIRIMGTFDLATGHADTFNELLDSLEVELRDVLGYYREALRKAQEK